MYTRDEAPGRRGAHSRGGGGGGGGNTPPRVVRTMQTFNIIVFLSLMGSSASGRADEVRGYFCTENCGGGGAVLARGYYNGWERVFDASEAQSQHGREASFTK